jgi:DNA (cytosine-5)-methyltransferase 1
VRELKAPPVSAHVITAGFPCTDLSQAGQLAGLAGAQSGLVREVFRLLRARATPWVIFENVPFMLHQRDGEALRYILCSLERLGYAWAYRVVDSRSFGVPQRRRRVFVVASLEDDPRTVLLSDDAGPPPEVTDDSRAACGFYWTEGNTGIGWAVDAIPPLKGGSGVGIPSPPAILMPSGAIVTPDIRDAERLQGFPANWTAIAGRRGAERRRWKLVGNAVTVGAARWLGNRLASPRPYDGSNDEPLRRNIKWPPAAWNLDGRRFASDVSAWPLRLKTIPLEQFLRHPGAPLSGRATRGFYTRLVASELRPSQRLLDALRASAELRAPRVEAAA